IFGALWVHSPKAVTGTRQRRLSNEFRQKGETFTLSLRALVTGLGALSPCGSTKPQRTIAISRPPLWLLRTTGTRSVGRMEPRAGTLGTGPAATSNNRRIASTGAVIA